MSVGKSDSERVNYTYDGYLRFKYLMYMDSLLYSYMFLGDKSLFLQHTYDVSTDSVTFAIYNTVKRETYAQ